MPLHRPRALLREPSLRHHVDLAVRPPAVARPVCRSAGAPPLSMAAENTTQILQENDTCWRVARCGRARVLIDAADYFLAVRRAFLKARHSIFIVGWDIDRRTRLLGAGGEAETDDDLPVARSEEHTTEIQSIM